MTSKTVALVVGLGLVLLPSVSRAQVELRVRVPTIRFEVAPPLVVVQEGVQVVPDHQDEVFVSDGWYWHRAHGNWYRTRNHRGGWVVVQREYVPVPLVKIPPGKYRHHRGKGSRKMYVQTPDGQVAVVKVKDRGGRGKKEKRGKGRWR